MNKKVFLLGSIAISLTGCDSVKHTLGLDHYQADEYAIPTTPPLSMPKDYNLRAPEINAQPMGYTPAKKKAQETLGAPASNDSNESEETLIKKASGGVAVDDSIRQTVDSEAAADKGVLDRLSNIGKDAADNLSGQGGNTAETSASKGNPAQTR